MIIVMRRETGHHRSVAGYVVDVGDALTAAVGPAIFMGGRQLAIAVGTDRQDELFLCGQFLEPLGRHLRRAFLFRLPRREAQVILALLRRRARAVEDRSEEHTSELQSLMRISYAVFCLKKKKTKTHKDNNNPTHTET